MRCSCCSSRGMHDPVAYHLFISADFLVIDNFWFFFFCEMFGGLEFLCLEFAVGGVFVIFVWRIFSWKGALMLRCVSLLWKIVWCDVPIVVPFLNFCELVLCKFFLLDIFWHRKSMFRNHQKESISRDIGFKFWKSLLEMFCY